MMKNKCEERLKTLRSEYETGQKMLSELDAKRQKLAETMARIEGAMQILQELIAEEEQAHPNSNGAAQKADARLTQPQP
jgi:predicted nuclease with TOPRIM domain